MSGIPQPSVGRIVHYRLTTQDVLNIGDHADHRDRRVRLVAGGVTAALIVGVNVEAGTVNLRLFLNGDMDSYVGGREQGIRPGQWSWPERV